MSSSASMIAIVPFNSRHPNFKHVGAFHPFTLPLKSNDKKVSVLDESKGYSARTAILLAGRLSPNIVATLPDKDYAWTYAAKELLATYCDPNNILAEVEKVYTSEESIAGQVKAAFEAFPGARSAVIIWPYQMFHDESPINGPGEATFLFSHPNLNVKRFDVPECIVLSAEDQGGGEEEMTCKDAMLYSEVDEMLRGNYVRTLSMVEIERSAFEAFVAGPDYPNIVPFLRETLKGKRGVMANPNGHSFI